MINPVKQYNLTPEQMANYKPGMDLGEPDLIYQPESLIKKGSIKPTIVSENQELRRVAGSKKTTHATQKRFKIEREEYLKLRKSGMSRDAICERFNIKLKTLHYYLSGWELGSKGAEEMALEKSDEPLPFADEDSES